MLKKYQEDHGSEESGSKMMVSNGTIHSWITMVTNATFSQTIFLSKTEQNLLISITINKDLIEWDGSLEVGSHMKQ